MNALWSRGFKIYVAVHGVWLGLYALLGKGFAYAGWPPFYAGEILLLVGIPALFATRRIVALCRTSLGIGLICFTAWQIVCAAPYLETYGIDTLRDSAIWGYSVFAWITAALVLRLHGFVDTVVTRYRGFAKVFLFLGPVAWLATLYLRDWLPTLPGTTISVPLIKAGDYSVHLAGILAFMVGGLGNGGVWWIVLAVGDAMLGVTSRGGLLAFLVTSVLIFSLRPRFSRLFPVIFSALTLVVSMAAIDFRLSMPGTFREVSLDQLSDSFVSVFGDSGRHDLEGTKGWRLTWWRAIRDYTVDGPYFWKGKGYGINLADSDGFQAGTREDPLRSPHSSHLTFLARSGVPGFLLWIGLQLTWGAFMLSSYIQARRFRLRFWTALFLWLLAYWTAFTVCAGFDVFLEGPMAGIPYWTLFGLGWGCYVLFGRQFKEAEGRTRGTSNALVYAH
jgi:hypothetical protein